jgi:hypothetical protein
MDMDMVMYYKMLAIISIRPIGIKANKKDRNLLFSSAKKMESKAQSYPKIF